MSEELCPDCCDQLIELESARAELATVTAERDYLLAFHDKREIEQMRRELADKSERP